MQRVITIDVAPLSRDDVDRVFEAVKICKEQDCIDFFAEATPLEVVDILVDCGLMKKKKSWLRRLLAL